MPTSTLNNACNSSLNARQPACQRCHRNKERCHFDNLRKACATCDRLGKLCQPRSWKRLGRRPVPYGFRHGSSSVIGLDLDAQAQPRIPSFSLVKRVLPTTHSFSCFPRQVGDAIATKEGFFNAHCSFMIGDTFTDNFQTTVLILFNHCPRILSDGYCALLSLMAIPKPRDARICEKSNLRLGARSLRSLAQLSPSIRQIADAAVVAFLGQILLAYNALLPLGSSTRIITRYTLWNIRTWYPAMQQLPALDPITITPVLIDTIDSLIRREIPILRYSETERMVVDRFSGICSSLLPLLYDLCECSYKTKMAPTMTNNISRDLARSDPYSDIEQRVMAWEPMPIHQLPLQFNATESATMFAQAHSYRLASLLIIHRLRYPLGTQDDLAFQYADSILQCLSTLLSDLPPSLSRLGLDYPLLVAMLEIPARGRETFNDFEPFRYRARQGEDLLYFVDKVQRARKEGFGGVWFELVESGMRGDFLP